MTQESSQTASQDELIAKLEQYREAVLDYSRLLASYIPVERLLPLTALRLARGLGVTHSKVLRYDPERGDLLLSAGVGWLPGRIGTARFATDAASPPGRCYLTRQPTIIGDLPNNAEFRNSDIMRDHGIVSLANVPVISAGQVWGVLEVDSIEPNRFDEGDGRFLMVMANILGVAVERAADHEALVSTAKRAADAAAEAADAQAMRLRELQHRMKNNLAVIMSMLQLEQRQQADPDVKARMGQLIDRVAAIAVAHDQLNSRNDEMVVDLHSYLAQLATSLGQQHGAIRIETEMEAGVVPLDDAVPLGLILNELTTNAVKYAFPERTGTIRIGLAFDRELLEGVLSVADDGVGMGPPRPGGMGTHLVDALAQQISGIVMRPSMAEGTTVIVRFPVRTAH